MAETNRSNRRTSQGDARAAHPLAISGLPTCTIHAAEDGAWHVVAQLASDEAAALAASAPSRDALCQRAQHALGLAGIGSRIDRERSMVGVYTGLSGAYFGEPTLILDGPAVLWIVGRAVPDAIRALLQAATEALRQSPGP
jgi:hypothetical protein